MPRIVPLQLLKCLKVLLDDNGGILSIGEVKRIAGLMNRYSKKLVSKCIYVQILKVTKTELLGEFMGVGGWSLVYNWLNDAIRAMNWPLVQEILELLLLCPVDVDRLKINSAPKLVKGLCRDGGNEGVRILAKRLVEQWLKVVTENTASTQAETAQQPTVPGTASTTYTGTTPPAIQSTTVVRQENKMTPNCSEPSKVKSPMVIRRQSSNASDEDPLADVADVQPQPASYAPTAAQKKASEAGLVFKLVYKDGQQVLTKVPKTVQVATVVEQEEQEETANAPDESQNTDREVEQETEVNGDAEAESASADDQEVEEETDGHTHSAVIDEEEDTRMSIDKRDKDSESSADDDTLITPDNKKVISAEQSTSSRKKSVDTESEKSVSRERKSSKDSKENKNKDKEHRSEKDKDKDRKYSSSSSSHKSSSHKSKSSSSSKSKSSSSSSSSSHRSSSDKHRSDKDRSSSGKDKDRKDGSSSSSSSSKHRSSTSSSKSSSSSSSKDKHRDKDKDKLANTSSYSHKKDKEREKETQIEKDKEISSKSSPSTTEKLGRIPKKPKDESESDSPKPTSITIPSKKASMSIEIRRDSEKTKTVKTYKSQFRSHGLTEEAPPPPSRKGLKKPVSSVSAPGTVIPTSLPSSLKRPSPPPSSSDSPTQKKSKIDINNLTVANEKPGAIKLIAPKKIQTLVETNLFSDALSAATGPKKVTKRKRPTTPGPGPNKDDPATPTSPDAPKVTPLKFYQDTLDEPKSDDKSDKENDVKENASNKTEDGEAADKDNSTEDDDDIPLKKVKEDIEQKVLQEQKTADESADAAAASTVSGSVDITGSDAEEDVATKTADEEPEARKAPGPGCGPNGPPGVLMLHRRKGPKKKLTWRPQEQLEQIRYFELDETERVNVTKAQSFMDMKNLERFGERDAINIARRNFTHDDNMRPQMEWRPLIEVDGVPPHPNGNQSKQRKVQAEREQTTLRALYFSLSMIPDSPAEAELEPHFAVDIPVIPLEDITGNPDAVSDYTNMPWPEPKSSPKSPEINLPATGKLPPNAQMNTLPPNNLNPYPGFMPQYPGAPAPNNMLQQQMQMPRPPVAAAAASPQAHPAWQAGNFNGNLGLGPMVGAPAVQQQNMMGPFGPNAGNPQWQMHAGGGGGGGVQYGPGQGPFNNAPNFGPLGLMASRVMPNMTPPSPFERNNMNNNHHNNNNAQRNNGGGWRTGSNFQDNNNGGNWRSGGGGPNRGNIGGNNSNSGMCKAFMRGHCRLGKSCKFIHPKSKRI
ncbi:serine/threonine-protein phosphatase 1 regulatory subunit 10 isoform X1 [Ceratitis capitata]|nr:serine/threonine-protein phosphatase 1 regulatory subunit 10 isoform X1 [Ceratitis capitata]XP_012159704.1 serine/threonine-protein phosphatase 1 regulatory subunit 10 isoform X1 [Ceratitis capitata]XP_020715971.1 serine/threonine-protein phosphatase 1 regulatory subunit 10 isoform X1 [Ceratitis capitata]